MELTLSLLAGASGPRRWAIGIITGVDYFCSWGYIRAQPLGRLPCCVGRLSGMNSGISKVMRPSMSSSRAVSAALMLPPFMISGLRSVPMPEINCQTGREIKLTSTWGFGTFSSAFGPGQHS